MANLEARLILHLAASEFSSAEIRGALKSIERIGLSEVNRRIEQARGVALGIETTASLVRGVGHDDRFKEHATVISNIEQLLLEAAGMSKAEASKVLYSELVRELGREYYLPTPNKIAFRLWMARLLDQVPAGEVMHIASRIRNEVVHGRRSMSDWPLAAEVK